MDIVKDVENAEHKVAGWFHKQATSAEKLFVKIEPLMDEAENAVKKISAVVDAETVKLGSPAVLDKLSGFLHAEIKVYATVNEFIANHKGAPVSAILHDAAKLLVQSLPAAAGFVVNELDTAVQVAYSVLAVA